MKIILSRKGFDSGYGGYPSLIMPDNEMIMLPIPCETDFNKYSEIYTKSGTSLYSIMKDLSDYIRLNNKTELTPESTCHLDPDLCDYSIRRKNNWSGAFGQIGSAQKVLENNNVSEGDIFIFFGWFANVDNTDGKYSFRKNSGKHCMFGYLQVDKIIHPKTESVPEQYKNHPHAKSETRLISDLNTLYIGRERLSFDKNIKGYGMFNFDDNLVLTKKGMSRTCWDLPDIFRGLRITYHNESSWKEGYFKSACRGQEFVIEENKEIEKWAINLIKNYSANRV